MKPDYSIKLVMEKTKKNISLISFVLLISLASFGQTTVIYIDPEYTGINKGTLAQPLNSWNAIQWKDGYSYLLKRGSTIKVDYKLRPGASNITIGAYGEGKKPLIKSSVQNTEKVIATHTERPTADAKAKPATMPTRTFFKIVFL